jgi:hypothetical protein
MATRSRRGAPGRWHRRRRNDTGRLLVELAFPVYQPRTYITPGYRARLASGFATALGAKVGTRTEWSSR